MRSAWKDSDYPGTTESSSLLKEWFYIVLGYGWAYGPDGNALTGKLAKSVITTGGPKDAYQSSGQNRFTIEEFLRPIEQTARLCGMLFYEKVLCRWFGTQEREDQQDRSKDEDAAWNSDQLRRDLTDE